MQNNGHAPPSKLNPSPSKQREAQSLLSIRNLDLTWNRSRVCAPRATRANSSNTNAPVTNSSDFATREQKLELEQGVMYVFHVLQARFQRNASILKPASGTVFSILEHKKSFINRIDRMKRTSEASSGMGCWRPFREPAPPRAEGWDGEAHASLAIPIAA